MTTGGKRVVIISDGMTLQPLHWLFRVDNNIKSCHVDFPSLLHRNFPYPYRILHQAPTNLLTGLTPTIYVQIQTLNCALKITINLPTRVPTPFRKENSTTFKEFSVVAFMIFNDHQHKTDYFKHNCTITVKKYVPGNFIENKSN